MADPAGELAALAAQVAGEWSRADPPPTYAGVGPDAPAEVEHLPAGPRCDGTERADADDTTPESPMTAPDTQITDSTRTTETTPGTANGVVLTDPAAAKVRALLSQEGRDDLALRVAVQPGGCSGLRYQLFFDERSLDGDAMQEYEGGAVKVVVDRMSVPYLWARPSTSSTPSRSRGSRSTTPMRAAPAPAATASARPGTSRGAAPLGGAAPRCVRGRLTRAGPMRIAVTGSVATDHLMTFAGRFSEQVLPEQIGPSRCPSWPATCRCAAAGPPPTSPSAWRARRPPAAGRQRRRDAADYLADLEAAGVDVSGVRTSATLATARFTCTTDLDQNQIGTFYPGAMAEAADIELAALGELDLVVVAPNDPGAMLRHTDECRRGAPPSPPTRRSSWRSCDGEADPRARRRARPTCSPTSTRPAWSATRPAGPTRRSWTGSAPASRRSARRASGAAAEGEQDVRVAARRPARSPSRPASATPSGPASSPPPPGGWASSGPRRWARCSPPTWWRPSAPRSTPSPSRTSPTVSRRRTGRRRGRACVRTSSGPTGRRRGPRARGLAQGSSRAACAACRRSSRSKRRYAGSSWGVR